MLQDFARDWFRNILVLQAHTYVRIGDRRAIELKIGEPIVIVSPLRRRVFPTARVIGRETREFIYRSSLIASARLRGDLCEQ